MRGADAPAVELNHASIQHVRKLLHQLLRDSAIPNMSSWEKALMPILLQATDDVNPDVQHGDDIDIRHYVKLKKIPGGRPGDTAYVSGLVFTKNLALKSMPRSISQPNILIVAFPLEYMRHQQHFMSLEPVIRQEREFLQNLVHRIAALRPHLLLVQRNISRLALEFLEQAKIATAYNVKPSVLEAISRCSQTKIISSMDKLAIKSTQVGKCANFYLKTYVHDGKKKTYMFLSGCPKELGCTIVLRGGDNQTLAKVKRITEFMIYVVYNLKLETCFMRDEFAAVPTYTGAGSIAPDSESSSQISARKQTNDSANGSVTGAESSQSSLGPHLGRGQSSSVPTSITNSETPTSSQSMESSVAPLEEINLPDDIPMPTFYADMIEKHKANILSASPFVRFVHPYLLVRAREQERRLVYLKRLRDQDLLDQQEDHDESKPRKFILIKPEMIHEKIQNTSKKVREVLHAVHDAEYDKALHSYRTQKRQWEAYVLGNSNLFDPFAHQNIVVLYSVVCTVTSVPCSGPDLLALGFYNEHDIDDDFEADCTLGQYVEDLCLGANTVCTANGCERKMFEHHRQYVHGEAQISVTVESHPCKVRGYQDIILMWSMCRICGKETQIMPMSDNTWKYSFGKYLELSFWSYDLHARAGVCPHDLHRNHLRYFGFKDVALRVQYDPITLLEVIVPRTRITWKVVNDLKLKNEVFIKVEDRLNRFMNSVKARIKSIRVDGVIPEKADACKEEVDRLMKQAVEDHLDLIGKLQDRYMGSKYYEIVPLNRAIRFIQEKVADWDNVFADFDQNFFPSEKDIRRLATLQLRKVFLDRNDSVTSLTSTDEGTGTTTSEGDTTEKTSPEDSPTLAPKLSLITAQTHDLLTAVAENRDNKNGSIEHDQNAPEAPYSTLEPHGELLNVTELRAKADHHLNLELMIPTRFPERAPGSRMPQPESQPVSPTAMRKINTSPNPRNDGSTNAEPSMLQVPERSPIISPPFVSGIPRPSEAGAKQAVMKQPLFKRTQSQPSKSKRDNGNGNIDNGGPSTAQSSTSNIAYKRPGEPTPAEQLPKVEKRLSERLGLAAVKASVSGHSLIPRSIANRRKESKVSTLAKHFEQLSREFEKERMKDRRQRAAKVKQARAAPMAAAKLIIEVYRNVKEAVEEHEVSDDDLLNTTDNEHEKVSDKAKGMAQSTDPQVADDTLTVSEVVAEDTGAELTETDDNAQVDSHAGSDVECLDKEELPLDDVPSMPDGESSLSSDAQLEMNLDLPKHEKRSLMKMLTNFWADRSASGWQALEYPLSASDHVFADSDIIIREDEPSSLISFALDSADYKSKLQSIQEKSGDFMTKHDKPYVEDSFLSTEEQMGIERSLLQSTGTHLKYQFQEGSAKMLCKIFYAEQFDAVRRRCGVADRIVESLSRCAKWDSKGGKSKSVFLKTLDDRLALKSLSPIETQDFLRFAPAYFQLMGEALFHELPSVIAKMLGFFQIIIKNPVTGVEFNGFVLVMENLFYARVPNRTFDLKGSMRNRRIQPTGEQNEVLLDENMVEFIYESPLFTREHSKKLLRASVYNDTLFLSRQNVMDYSLMIGFDESRKELVVGIIDCIRTYTWDKKLESWMKDRGKNRPTVTSPKEYKSRFREAMGRYVLHAPK
jgi:1-phosphatidylinositol-3-phosphate 5-kinase